MPGLLLDDAVYPVPFATMLQLIEAGDKGLERARRAADGKRIALADATLHAPLLRPTTLRDAYAFETHVKTANANRDREVPAEWYKFPVFYFSNPGNVFGPDDEIPNPNFTSELDYELEIAAVIGKPSRDVKPEDAPKHIFRYTIFNDWSARDVQREEMKVALGPGKGKDFASSLGPCIVTLDELTERATGRPAVFDLPTRPREREGVVARQFQGHLLGIWGYPRPSAGLEAACSATVSGRIPTGRLRSPRSHCTDRSRSAKRQVHSA